MANVLHYYPGQFHSASAIVAGTTDTTIGGGLLVYLVDGKRLSGQKPGVALPGA